MSQPTQTQLNTSLSEQSRVQSNTQLSAHSIALIESSLGWRKDRVERLTLTEKQGEVAVIVKGQRPTRSAMSYKTLTFIAKLLRSPYAVGVLMYGAAHSQTIEINRLQALAAAGCPVPQLLHSGADYFVMQSLGSTPLGHAITGASPPDQQILWLKALNAIQQVHLKNQYLSQCFARNILLHDDQVYFIDFEDDALEVMSLPNAQVRDWLIFLCSIAELVQFDIEWAKHTFLAALSLESADTKKQFISAAKRLAFLRHLPTRRKPWGRDVQRLQAAGRWLWHFSKT